jgi:glycosyltransferase involved in cell wall biosynthesis
MHNDTKTRHKNFVEILAGISRPDLVIANSAFTAASLPLLFSESPPHIVVPCPVSLPQVRSSVTAERFRIRTELRTSMEDVVIVLVGRPEPWKGHAELLGALALLREQPGWVCWIAGGAFTPEQSGFLATLDTLGNELAIADRIRFAGQREDVADLLAAADIFCQPNVTPEPFGIVFIEALYAGLPVVTTDHGGGREIVNASCGRLVPPSDPAALAEALRELVGDADLRRSLSDHAPIRGAQISDPARVLPAVETALAGVDLRCGGVIPTAARHAPDLNPMAHG